MAFTGVLTGVARELFNSTIAFEVLSHESTALSDGQHQDHVIFLVTMESKSNLSSPIDIDLDMKQSACPHSDLVKPNDLCTILPYHIVFSPTLEVIQVTIK